MIQQQAIEIDFTAAIEMNLKKSKCDLGSSKHWIVKLGNAECLKERVFKKIKNLDFTAGLYI